MSEPRRDTADPSTKIGMDDPAALRRSQTVGLVLVLLAAVFWSLSGALIKSAIKDGAGPDGVTIAFYRSLFAGLCLLPLARGRMGTLRPSAASGFRGPLRPAAVCCVVFFAGMTVCFVVANVLTRAANAITLQYTSTFWVFALSPWLLKESPGRRELRLLALAMVGVVIIFGGNARTDLLGLVVALGAGLFFGLLTLMIRKMRDSDPAAIMVVNNLGSALLILPLVLIWGDLSLSGRSLIYMLLLGVVQFGLPYYLYTLGLARVPAHQVALLTLLEPVLVPIWTYLAVGETVPMATAIGGGTVVMALVLFLRSARLGHRGAA